MEAPFKEWALADMARVSLASGKEHRNAAVVNVNDLGKIHDAYMAFDDPFTKREPTWTIIARSPASLDVSGATVAG